MWITEGEDGYRKELQYVKSEKKETAQEMKKKLPLG